METNDAMKLGYNVINSTWLLHHSLKSNRLTDHCTIVKMFLLFRAWQNSRHFRVGWLDIVVNHSNFMVDRPITKQSSFPSIGVKES